MYEALGRLIRERRESLELDQAALAAQLDVGQQAVSAWENGRSRPRRAMLGDVARVLAIDEDALLDAGEYAPRAGTVGGPVRPLTRALPLDSLTEERFEDLLTEVMETLNLGGHASRYGGRGHKQYGIDILVASDGTNLATGQCKRQREFGPAAVTKAINEVTVKSPKNYLFLSRLVATPAARAEVAKHPSWELWDGEDISRYIRKLPLEHAVRIVDTYFPGHRESFLGVPSPGPWLRPEDHFNGNRTAIFHQEWSLAGRESQRGELASAAYQANATAAFLVGAGGTGKTRMIKAIAEAAPGGTDVLILPGDAQVSASDFELLPPTGQLTVIIDDAHEIPDVTGIVAGIWRRNAGAKVLLATRPYGLPALREEMARHGLLPVPHTEVVLKDLEFDDAAALAREALGDAATEAVVRRLARLTADSPLVTVVGGVLIRQGQLDPAALEQDESIRLHIMRGFRDALVNDPLAHDQATRREVLDAVAALQPLRADEESTRASLCMIVGKPFDEIHKHLRSLENAGILRRRGATLRIVPDLLGDVILTEAALDGPTALGTGYLTRIEPLVSGPSAEHLFVNVSRVDWQVHNLRQDDPSLADSLWDAFRRQIETADVLERRTLADTLAKAAYFRPARALELTRWLIENPTDHLNDEHAAWRGLIAVDYSSVLEALPPAIMRAGMTEDTLPEALAQLWELSQLDHRPTNPHPSHPLRVLCELADFGPAKPIWFNDQIVDVVSTWFVDGQRLSPFDVLEPMLATEGDDATFRGHTITFKPFVVNPQSVMRVRQRIIDLAFEELVSPDLRRSGAAAKILGSAMQFPMGRFGRTVSSDELEAWTPGILDTIDRLGARAAQGGLDPAVLVGVREALFWHDNYGSGPTSEAAQRAVESLPGGIEALLGLMVHDGWGHLVRDRGDDFEAIESKRVEIIGRVIEGLAERTDQEVVELLVARLGADRELYGPNVGHPGPLLERLVTARPTLAHAMLERLRGDTAETDLDQILPIILGTYATLDPAAALEDVRELLASESVDRRRAVAQAIGWNRGPRALHPGELDLLLELASDADEFVRRNVVRAAQLIGRTHKAEATRLMAAVRFGDSERLADEYFMSWRLDDDISWSDFSDPELELIRQDLVRLPAISGYSVLEALSDRSGSQPEWVLGVLRERIELAQGLGSLVGYQALPYSWDSHLRIRDTSSFVASLNGILEWIAEKPTDWLRSRLGADLFAAVAVVFDDQAVDVLRKALAGGMDKLALAVVAVLHEAPRTFIWDQPDFVRVALHAADKLGEEIRQEMVRALWAATITGIRSGTPGEPFPETLEQRDRSLEVAKGLPAGSIERRFYVDIASAADRDILREVNDDLPTDGRSW
ncbi:MAG: helix-turn-helix domain-containing protein [Candidatus Nanopelagicales bacterium]|nr:helix-turn-helix domain-containing protein [Candidatus Nanopelagicales bacterium]